MKRLTIMIVLMVIIVSADVANAQFNHRCVAPMYRRSHVYVPYSMRPYRPPTYYPYGCGRDRTLDRVLGCGGLVVDIFQTARETSESKQALNAQISATDRTLSMAEREQVFRHEQIRAQSDTKQENEKLREEIKNLELRLKKLELQQKIDKQKNNKTL